MTSTSPPPHPCSVCGVAMVETLHPDATSYYCNGCMRQELGPVRQDFSWWDAGEAWMGR